MTSGHSPLHQAAAPTDAAALPVFADADEGDLLLRVSGILPAADFHPFVVRTARRLGVRGWVRHDSSGAQVRAVGTESQLVKLVRAIRDDAPASARIRGLDTELITAETPAVGDRFIAIVEPAVEWHDPNPANPPPLAHVA